MIQSTVRTLLLHKDYYRTKFSLPEEIFKKVYGDGISRFTNSSLLISALIPILLFYLRKLYVYMFVLYNANERVKYVIRTIYYDILIYTDILYTEHACNSKKI